MLRISEFWKFNRRWYRFVIGERYFCHNIEWSLQDFWSEEKENRNLGVGGRVRVIDQLKFRHCELSTLIGNVQGTTIGHRIAESKRFVDTLPMKEETWLRVLSCCWCLGIVLYGETFGRKKRKFLKTVAVTIYVKVRKIRASSRNIRSDEKKLREIFEEFWEYPKHVWRSIWLLKN